MQRTSFIVITIIAAFLLAAASAVQACGPKYGRDKGQGFEGRGGCIGGRGMDACIDEMNLTSDQIGKFREIRENHLEKMDKIREKWAGIRAKERSFLSGESLDQAEADAIIQQGAELWKERAKERLDYQQKLLGILTQEQKDRLYMCQSFKQKGCFGQQGCWRMGFMDNGDMPCRALP